jgi:hypothetical protein
MASDITLIHTAVMKVPKSFVRVVSLSYPAGLGLHRRCGSAHRGSKLRIAQRPQYGRELQQLWWMFQHLTGMAADQLAISLQEIPSSNAMEMGQIMTAVGPE